MNFIKYISNLSATGQGVEQVFIPAIINYLNDAKSNNLKIKVLDFGCSQKPYKYLFANYDNVVEYIGIDVYNGEQVDIVYDGNKIPIADNYFDLIFSTSVLEHVEDVDNTLSEIHRV